MVLGAEGRDQGHQGRGALLKYRGEWSETAKPNALTILRYQVLGLFCSACIYSTCLYKTHMHQCLPHHDQTQRVM